MPAILGEDAIKVNRGSALASARLFESEESEIDPSDGITWTGEMKRCEQGRGLPEVSTYPCLYDRLIASERKD